MARFRYRMQNILSVKEKLETQAKNDYARALMTVSEQEDELQRRKDHLTDLEREAREARLKDSLSIRDLEDTNLAVDLQKQAIEAQKQVMKKARDEAEIRREAMVELMQERKTHEILKQRQFEEFLKEQSAAESKEIDQLTSYTYGQKLK